MIDFIILQIKKRFSPEFIYFCIVGTIGFSIDYTVLHLMHLEYDVVISRMVSMFCAITFTWLANRNFTFKTQSRISHAEWLKYFGVYLLGALINFCVFLFVVKLSPFFQEHLIIPLVLATGVSLFSNFTLSKNYTFKEKANE